MKSIVSYITEAKKKSFDFTWKQKMADDIDDSNLLDICHYMIKANGGRNQGVNTIYIPYMDVEKFLYHEIDPKQLKAEYESVVDLLGSSVVAQIVDKFSLSRSGKQRHADVCAQTYVGMLRWMSEEDPERLNDIWPGKE